MTDTSGDEIEICQNVEPHEDEDSVKSKAVVKFEAVQVPARFTKLQCNTDLNLPPSNWLSNSANSYGIQQSIYHSAGFASFRMANMFSDSLGEVDVVSDAENIKKLLKLPYSPKGAISMMIHRVENTLLIDEFDIQKYLLRQADDDWQWLRTFIFENILSSLGEKDRNFCIKDKSRGALQQKNLLSKFLYHSLLANESKTAESPEESQSTGNGKSIRHKTLLAGPILPEANIEENVPDPNSNHVFNRNVVWTFEDIRMLIGTDMPIFGGGTRPCISLRLRNMAEPINVLTGIDYWLDNLMCNVPEVVMCYHLDGIVQRYELIKTEDLPYLEDSKFSPQVIRNVAQNILSFLKANATKAGHTYWLFKGKNDDVVKLYDLTTLCKKGEGQSKNENPFTVPVAMLLYTVARNMKNSTTKISARKAGSIKTLLDNCIKLLPKEKYPQIVTSSHYILSDLQVPAGIDPKSPKFNNGDLDSDSQSVYDDDYNSSECSSPEREEPDEYLENKDNVAVKSICDTLKEFTLEDNWKNNRSPSPLIGAVEERCLEALQHIYEGIDCLQYFASNEEELQKEKVEMEIEQQKKKIIHEEQHPNMARPFQPIPLPYESLKSEPKLADPNTPIPLKWEGDEESASSSSSCTKSKQKNKLKKSKKGDLQTIDENYNNLDQKIIPQDSSKLSKSWDIHLKLLLLEKACLTYATLAEHNYGLENYGISLRQIYAAIKCQKVVGHYITTISSQRNCLLGRAGDCFFQMTKTWDNIDVCLEQFENFEKIDKSILAEIEKDTNRDLQEELPVPGKNLELLMLSSCKCYEIALQAGDGQTSRQEIIRRLGNVRNELGVKYMHWAQEEYTKYMETETTQETSAEDKKPDDVETDPVYQTLAKKSFDSLIKGIAAFEEVKDDINLYFLLCNMGRFMRFRAHIHLKGEPTFDVRRQKRFYVEAFSYYQRALSILGSRKKNPELWDLANWELSTASFTLAKQVQDFSDSEQIELEVEHETVELLQKSLKYCDVEHPGSRQVLYTFRSGLIHHRLASFYHSQLRKSHDDSKKKTNLQLCRMHYEKGAAILDSLNESKDFLRVQIERIALQEFLAEGSNNTQKIKNLQIALDIFIQSKSILNHIIDSEVETDRFAELLKLFESRLQFVLRTLAKTCSMKTGTKDSNKLGDLYKKMYSATLKVCDTSDERKYAKHLSAILDTIMDLNAK